MVVFVGEFLFVVFSLFVLSCQLRLLVLALFFRSIFSRFVKVHGLNFCLEPDRLKGRGGRHGGHA